MSARVITLPIRRRDLVEVERCTDPATGQPVYVFELITLDGRRIPFGSCSDAQEAATNIGWLRRGKVNVIEVEPLPKEAVAQRFASRLVEAFQASQSAILRGYATAVKADGVPAALAVLSVIDTLPSDGTDPSRDLEAQIAISSIDVALAVRASASSEESEAAVVSAEWAAARACSDHLKKMVATARGEAAP